MNSRVHGIYFRVKFPNDISLLRGIRTKIACGYTKHCSSLFDVATEVGYYISCLYVHDKCDPLEEMSSKT